MSSTEVDRCLDAAPLLTPAAARALLEDARQRGTTLVDPLAAALSVGLWLSALNVKYRDVRYTIPFLAQFWLFVTPVAYSSSLVPPKWQTLYGINPMVGVVEGFRWALLGKSSPPGAMLMVSVTATAILLVGGLFYFRRMEKSFADIV